MGALPEGAHCVDQDPLLRVGQSLSAGGPCRTGHPFVVLGLEEPSQKIELVFSASPETIRRGLGFDPLAQSAIGGTWQPARS